MGLKERLLHLEKALRERGIHYPGNEDNFVTALGVNEKDFEKGGGFDFISALNETAAEDWKAIQ